MELKLYFTDLQPELQVEARRLQGNPGVPVLYRTMIHDSTRFVGFEHFTEDARTCIRLVGRGVFYSSYGSYEAVYAPTRVIEFVGNDAPPAPPLIAAALRQMNGDEPPTVEAAEALVAYVEKREAAEFEQAVAEGKFGDKTGVMLRQARENAEAGLTLKKVRRFRERTSRLLENLEVQRVLTALLDALESSKTAEGGELRQMLKCETPFDGEAVMPAWAVVEHEITTLGTDAEKADIPKMRLWLTNYADGVGTNGSLYDPADYED